MNEQPIAMSPVHAAPPFPATAPVVVAAQSWQARWFHLAIWLAIIGLAVLFLRSVAPILLPFVLGILVAYVMDPLAVMLERRGVGRSLATGIITFGLFATLTGLVIWLVPLIYGQLISLLSRAPAMLHKMELNLHEKAAPLLTSLNHATGGASGDVIPTDMSEIAQNAMTAVGVSAQHIFASGAALVNVVALLLITPIVCFYLIRDWPSMVRSLERLLPLAYAPTIRTQVFLINRTLSGYLRGQITVMLIMCAYYVIALSILGLNFSLVLGLFAGFIIIIPYIGSVISVCLGLLVAHGQFDGSGAFWFAVAIYGMGQILESQILTPKIIGDRVGLHPLWMLFGMLAGGVLLGIVGVLLAVPLTAVIGVLVKFTIARYLESGLYLEP